MGSTRVAAALAVAAAVLLAGCGTAGEDSAATDSTSSETSSDSAADGSASRPEPDPGVDKYPLGEGRYVVESDPGWVYFRTATGVGCGIGPVGRIVGCDAVPSHAPAGTNQTMIEGNRPAVYRMSETQTFTRETGVLREGHRLTNGATRCAVGRQDTVRCETVGGAHGFIVSPNRGVLW
jgi:hypothetical protein